MIIWLIVGFIAFVALGIFIANNSQSEFWRLYQSNRKIKLESGKAVQDFLEEIKGDNILGNVGIVTTEKELEDAYIKNANIARLSTQTIYGNDLASFCIVAHEFGHAEQNATEDKKYFLSNKLRKLSRVFGAFTMPFALVGLLMLLFLESNMLGWLLIGFCAFSLLLILISNLLITVVEFNASSRAIQILKRYDVLTTAEIKKAKKFLKGAGYTYLGNFCSTLFSWTFLVPNPKII